MAPRTLWTIILKIFGLYLLVQLLNWLPQLFSIIVAYSSIQNESYGRGGINVTTSFGPSAIGEIAASLFSISICLLMIATFIFKTDWLIDALRLNNAITEEKLELNIHRSAVLKIAIIITGGLLLIESLPVLLKELFDYYQNINLFNGFKTYTRGGYIILNLVKVFISFFMITSSRFIVNFIERKRKGKVKTEDTRP